MPVIDRRAVLGALALTAPLLARPGLAQSSPYPARSVRILVGDNAGGAGDITMLIIAEGMQGFPRGILVENRPGAGGNIAAEATARAAPDGYSLLLTHAAAMAINPVLYCNVPFDSARDFTAISLLNEFPFVIVVHASVPVRDFAEFVAWARAQREPVIYASPNAGSQHHLGMEQLATKLGFRTSHVGFRGGGPATTALLGGQVMVGSIGLPPLVPHLREGRLRALAVSTATRSPQAPDVPTLAEAGVRDLSLAVWFGLVGPRGMAAEVVNFVDGAVAAALARPDVQQKLIAQGLTPRHMGPAAFDIFLAAERQSWGEAARAANITID